MLCVIAMYNGAYAADVAINDTNFPDEAFRSYVSKNFDTNSDNLLSVEEIASVTTIKLPSINHIGHITNLKGIEYFTALTVLDYQYNNLTNLDVSNNTALTRLNCSDNQLRTLDVSKNTALTWLHCYGNSLISVDVSKNTVLEVLLCQNNQLTKLDVSKCTALTNLHCYYNELTALDISSNIALTELLCYKNQLTNLDIRNNTALTYLEHYSQVHRGLNIASSGNSSYPYQLNFSEYMSTDKFANVSNVQGKENLIFDIVTKYSGGIAYFESKPAIVTYSYATGYTGSGETMAMDVTLSGDANTPEVPSPTPTPNPDTTPATHYYERGDSGDSWETAYVINSIDDLKIMRDRVNSGTEPNGKYYKLGTNIDISSETDWIPIGYSSGSFRRSFNGNFDGQNHILTVNISTDQAVATIWGYVGSSGGAESTVIKNLNVEGSVKCIHYEAYDGGIPLLGTDTSYASGLVYQLTSGSIENCNFTGTIEVFGTARAYAGGIVRHLRGITDTGVSTNASVKNCTFKGTIKAEVESSLDGSVHVGGIICATDSGIVENCQTLNETTIIVSSRSGEKRYDIGYPAVGGIVGSASFETEISNCTSNANIIGYEYAGGIAGEIEPNCHLFGNSWPSSQYPEVGNGLSNNTPNNDTTDQDENTVVPSPITSQDKISDKLELAVISPVFISDEIIEKLAKNISVDVKEINLLTSADFDPSEPPEPTDAMRKTITSRNSQFMAKMNTIKVSKDGWYVFMVTVSDDLVGTKVGDLRLYGAEASDFTASSFNAAFDLMPIVNGITGSLEISNFFGVKLDTLPKQFLATMFLSASQSLTVYIVKILLLLLGGCDVGFGVIGGGLMIVAGGVFTIKLIKRKRH